jgi:hypothetical protein
VTSDSFFGGGDLLSVHSDAERPGDSGSGVFIAEEVEVGDKGLGDTASVKAETYLVSFLEDFHT